MKKILDSSIIKECCSKKCFGIDDNHGSCCSIANRNFIIGPIRDPSAFLNAVRKKFQDDTIRFDDVLMEFDEGRVFCSQDVWQNPDNYPCLRINPDSRMKHCVFYNPFVRACSIYSIRPEPCRKYKCSYLNQRLGITEVCG